MMSDERLAFLPGFSVEYASSAPFLHPSIRLVMIDIFFFEQQFQRFREHVIKISGMDLTSFSSNPYTEEQEGYKYNLYRNARKLLKIETWKESDIGSGKISRSVLKAIQMPANNLVPWQSRWGDENRPHNALCIAVESNLNIEVFDSVFHSLYRKFDDLNILSSLVNLFGRKYALIAYLLFLKDRNQYMPIAPSSFDKAFSLLGASFSTSHKCSWENYLIFNNILAELKTLLAAKLAGEVSLLDAHSFAWMISKTIENNELSQDNIEYLELPKQKREAVVQARIGQGYFRDALVNYWRECAVTKCQEISLLRASHIKPWSKCNARESVDHFNGFLLSPTIDAAFDAGFISFDDTRKILISNDFQESDAEILGISPSLCLSRIEKDHRPYLKYHREHIFRKS